MAICANCTDNAIYVYQITPVSGINYCQYHLPRFLYQQRDAGILPAPVDPIVEEPVVEEPTTKTKKKAVATDSVVDAPVVVDTPVEDPAPTA